jgi:hypothetical protein
MEKKNETVQSEERKRVRRETLELGSIARRIHMHQNTFNPFPEEKILWTNKRIPETKNCPL